MINNSPKKLPVGVFTALFLVLGLTIHFWPKSSCSVLEESLSSGYFMRWLPPVLLIVKSDKSQLSIEANSKSEACDKALEKISIKRGS